ncbi:hypothetical protein HWB51_gp056 [Mycobacterium phage Cuke]|uniref:Uncharacterized protein n=1 Tax=Mycobacterium phage Cuke TaxID=2079417 RepID=A0A2L1IWW6_9CAUD|nr:hypothetical protein HWB51_gp056 [Mycobacterium phage Cuke]AVD99674.1 hypothetical protein SEA_CUKE_56 [Mycobacterium phage Cuke]
MKTFLVVLMAMALSILGIHNAYAEPSSPCGYTSNLPWSPCAEISPFQTYPGYYDPQGKTPGAMGPWGYVPKVG